MDPHISQVKQTADPIIFGYFCTLWAIFNLLRLPKLPIFMKIMTENHLLGQVSRLYVTSV